MLSTLSFFWPWRGLVLAFALGAAWWFGNRGGKTGDLLPGGLIALAAGLTNTPWLNHHVWALHEGPTLDGSTALLTLALGILGLLGAYIAYLQMVNGTRDTLFQTSDVEAAKNHWADWKVMTTGMIVVALFVLFLLTWIETNNDNLDHRHLLRIIWLAVGALLAINLYSIPIDVRRIQRHLATLSSSAEG